MRVRWLRRRRHGRAGARRSRRDVRRHHPGQARGGTLPSQIRAATRTTTARRRQARRLQLFEDVNGIACIQDTDTPSMGGMGFHWINGAKIGSADPAQWPAHLRPGPLARPARRWSTSSRTCRPVPRRSPSWGTRASCTPRREPLPGRHRLLSLHVWAWDPSPDGLYSMWNPRVSCP